MREPVRHRWMDRWLGAKGPALLGLTHEVGTAFDAFDARPGVRVRRRKPEHEVTHRTLIETITANLAYTVISPPETGRLSVLTGNAVRRVARYNGPVVGAALRDHCWRFAELGLADHHTSTIRREASSIAPTNAFAAAVTRHGVTLTDFGRRPGEEVIRLTCKEPDPHRPEGGLRESLPYEDTPETDEMRATVRRINSHIEGADIAFLEDGGDPVDPNNRVMRRHFLQLNAAETPRFDLGGRLYGGFWQNLERGRRSQIRLNGEAVAVLDFASMFPRLAYARAGVTPPAGDLYAIPGLEDHRDAVKLLVNALLFDNYTRSTWPKEAKVGKPHGLRVPQMRRLILAKHPALRKLFGKRLGLGLMFDESRILIDVLDDLRSRDVPALGLHDGLFVPTSRAEEVRRIMEEAAEASTGIHLPVTVKPA